MAIGMVQEFDVDPDDRSTTNYDAIAAELNPAADPPAGLILHTAGFTGTGVFRIMDVWETEADWTRFRDERLMPIVEKIVMGAGGGDVAEPPREYTYELHDLFPA
jgi:hypothetical protein